jgi:NADP-dependent 3-hydroxy acid dehydrogenase YdfG
LPVPGRIATDVLTHVHGESPATRARLLDGVGLPEASDIAGAIAVAIAAAWAVKIGQIEITPTWQVPDGLSTVRPGGARSG